MSADRLDDKSSSPVDAVAASDAAICLNSPSSPPGLSKGVSVTSKDDHLPDGSVVSAKKRLTLLELPMDILKEIIKEVTRSSDLTSLALTCSTLHALAIPNMYSRFDIVWPEALTPSDELTGVDALSYGLATLVMGQDVFSQMPPSHHQTPTMATYCASCGNSLNNRQSGAPLLPTSSPPPAPALTQSLSRTVRRGNYYAQYTRKFSIGNGPASWVQEYSITQETGKMLGTLVALAVARMINLETFIWDMPTGVVRDVWIALASLADRPGHECRLERVWVRWHDNSARSMPDVIDVPAGGWTPQPLFFLQKYAHVEYPTLSILPPLKSLSVLAIDEPSYLDELAVLVERSRHRLKELRIGISAKACRAEWLKRVGNWDAPPDPSVSTDSGWPRRGGVFGALSSKRENSSDVGFAAGQTNQDVSPPQADADDGIAVTQTVTKSIQDMTLSDVPAAPAVPVDASVSEGDVENLGPGSNPDTQASADDEHPPLTEPEPKPPSPPPTRILKKSRKSVSDATLQSTYKLLKLETLELERVLLCVPYSFAVLDWTCITTLTILRCEDHEKLWRALRRRYMPSAIKAVGTRSSNQQGLAEDAPIEYSLTIKHLHTDAVSPYLLLFIKDTIKPNTLESVFLQESSGYESPIQVDAIYRNVIRKHRLSLRKLLIDSSERTANGSSMTTTRWRKWMFNREILSFVTSGRLPRLRELGMAIHSKNWHFFLQRLPYTCQLRALYIPHIGHPIHRDSKELALQILDIVTICPEIEIAYIGVQQKCFEILECRRSEKSNDSDDHDDSPSDTLQSSNDAFLNWVGSAATDNEQLLDEDGDGDEDEGEGGVNGMVDSVSDILSSSEASADEGDDEAAARRRKMATFRLREILFYDDKIAIFKARHGVL